MINLVNLPPTVLFNICKDIQVSGNWKQFAMIIGFSITDIQMIEMTSNIEHFHADEVLRRWFCKSPTIIQLIEALYSLSLETPLYKLNDYVSREMSRMTENDRKDINKNHYLKIRTIINITLKRLVQKRNHPKINDNDLNFQESDNKCEMKNETLVSRSIYTNASDSIDIAETEKKLTIEPSINEINIYKSLLNRKSNELFINEFNVEDISYKLEKNKFSKCCFRKLRGTMFNIQSFHLEKILNSKKKKLMLYNIIWSLTNLKSYSLSLLIGYCFYENYLILIYPHQKMKSLFDILHRTQSNNDEILSSQERLKIIRTIGEVLIFFHSFQPFPVYHGQIMSHNVMISPTIVILSGFEKLHTEDNEYMKDVYIIRESKIKSKDYRQKDIIQYLELICEIMFNIQRRERESLIHSNYKPILFTTLNYPGWCEDMNDKINKLIGTHSNDLINSNVEKILLDLSEI